MGCIICKKRDDTSDVVMNRAHQSGFRELFRGTNDFAITRSDSENEDERDDDDDSWNDEVNPVTPIPTVVNNENFEATF